MKKNLVIICAMAALVMASCSQKPSKPVFNNQIDSLSYCFGLARTNGFPEYLVNQMEVDTAYMDQFVKGFMQGAAMSLDDPAKKAYMAGLEIGSSEVGNMMLQINQQLFGEDSDVKFNKDNYISGFLAGAAKDYSLMDVNRAGDITDSLINIITTQINEEKYSANKIAGEEFLAAKAKEANVIALESGILYEVIKEGNGAVPTEDNTVNVKYTGTLIDGTEFDSSEEGIQFPVLGVIKGWQEILQIMPVGSEWKVYIPSELAYGEAGASTIDPYSVLVFDMELLDIVK